MTKKARPSGYRMLRQKVPSLKHVVVVSWYQNVSILDFVGAKNNGDSGDNWSSTGHSKLQPNNNKHCYTAFGCQT